MVKRKAAWKFLSTFRFYRILNESSRKELLLDV